MLTPPPTILNYLPAPLNIKNLDFSGRQYSTCVLRNLKVLAIEAEARIHAARETALAAESVLEARQDEARELRKSHEKAVAELAAEMAEKKRRGKEGVASRLQVGHGRDSDGSQE